MKKSDESKLSKVDLVSSTRSKNSQSCKSNEISTNSNNLIGIEENDQFEEKKKRNASKK